MEITTAASMAAGSMATASIIMLDMAAENMAAADIVNKARLCYCSIVMIKLNRAGGLAFARPPIAAAFHLRRFI